MILAYRTQLPIAVIGTKTTAGVRTPVTLTNAYNTTVMSIVKTAGHSKLDLDLLYTMGATETSNSIEVKVECSTDGINFYRIPNESTTGGTSTLTAREFTFVGADAAATTISIGLDIFYKYVKVSLKETGVVTNFGTVYVEGTLSGF